MVFLDYDRIVRDNKEHIIDSYVKQYGENFRGQLAERFDKIRFCFYETPSALSMYIQMKANEVGIKLTRLCLLELNITNFRCGYSRIESDNKDVARVINLIFSYGQPINLLNNECNNLSSLPLKDLMLITRVTKKTVRQVTETVQKYMQQFSSIFNEMEDYLDSFKTRITSVEETTYAELIKAYTLLNKYRISYTDMKSIAYFGIEDLAKKYGIPHDEILLLNEEIASFLKAIGKVKFREYIINNYNPNEYIHYNGFYEQINNPHALSMSGYEQNTQGVFTPVVYFSPMSGYYGHADIIFDHETRHAMEMNLLDQTPQLIRIKSGLGLYEYSNGDLTRRSFNNLNEIMTQKMSIESTKARQKQGVFIFDESEYVNGNDSTGYDRYIPKFERTFDDVEYNALIEARLRGSYDELYQIISYDRLTQIDSEIMTK